MGEKPVSKVPQHTVSTGQQKIPIAMYNDAVGIGFIGKHKKVRDGQKKTGKMSLHQIKLYYTRHLYLKTWSFKKN